LHAPRCTLFAYTTLFRSVKKFAYQRFEPSGFTKNPDIRNATSITDYVFRWLACQFIKGYKEATSPHKGQQELPLKELSEIDKKADRKSTRLNSSHVKISY